MTNGRHRICQVGIPLATACMLLLGGCTHGDPANVELFLTDLLRNAAAALLL